MKRQTVNTFVEYAVKKPVLYILFLILGCGAFAFSIANTSVPVYTRYAGTIVRSGDMYEISLHDEKSAPLLADSVYICVDDSQRLYPLRSFELTERKLTFFASETPVFQDGEISLDIETGRIPLYRMLLKQGGLYDAK